MDVRSLARMLVPGLLLATMMHSAHAQPYPVRVEIAGEGRVVSVPGFIRCELTCTASVPMATPLMVFAQPAAGFRFGHWSGACSGSDGCTLPANTAATVGATFEPLPTYSFTIERTGNGEIRSLDSALEPTIDCGTTCAGRFPEGTVTLRATPAAGAVFSGWSGACPGSSSSSSSSLVCIVNVDSDTAVGASFRAATQPRLTVTGTAGGVLRATSNTSATFECRGDCTANADLAPGTVVTLTATPDAGYAIARWSGACEARNTGGGNAGRRRGETGDGPQTTCPVLIDADRSVGIEFALDAASSDGRLTVTVVGEGRVVEAAGRPPGPEGAVDCPGQCAAGVPNGTVIELNAIPADGYVLDRFDGSCGNRRVSTIAGGDCNVTVQGDTPITARFVAEDAGRNAPSLLRISIVGEGAVTSSASVLAIDCPGTCEFGGGASRSAQVRQRELARVVADEGGVPLTANPADGYRLAGWQNCDRIGDSNDCLVTAEFSNRTVAVVATFERTASTPPSPPSPPPGRPTNPPAPAPTGTPPGLLPIIQQLLDE